MATYTKEMNYRKAHNRVARAWGPAKRHSCVSCGGPALDWAYQYTAGDAELRVPFVMIHRPGAKYSADINDYAPMCRRCHKRFDARMDPTLIRSGAAAGKRYTYICRECLMTAAAGNLGRHQKAYGHTGRRNVTALVEAGLW